MFNLDTAKNAFSFLNKKRLTVGEHIHGKLSVAETSLHISYCSAAFMEGHGVYATCALLLAIVIVLASIFHAE